MDYVIHLGDYIYEYQNGDYGWGKCTFLSKLLPIHTIFESRDTFREQTNRVTHAKPYEMHFLRQRSHADSETRRSEHWTYSAPRSDYLYTL